MIKRYHTSLSDKETEKKTFQIFWMSIWRFWNKCEGRKMSSPERLDVFLYEEDYAPQQTTPTDLISDTKCPTTPRKDCPDFPKLEFDGDVSHPNPFILKKRKRLEKRWGSYVYCFEDSKRNSSLLKKQKSYTTRKKSWFSQNFLEMRKLHFEHVLLTQNKTDGVDYVIKISKLNVQSGTHTENSIFREAMALSVISRLGCSNIVRFHHAWVEKQFLYTQFEYCQCGSLSDYYKNQDIFRKGIVVYFVSNGNCFEKCSLLWLRSFRFKARTYLYFEWWSLQTWRFHSGQTNWFQDIYHINTRFPICSPRGHKTWRSCNAFEWYIFIGYTFLLFDS